MWIFNLIYDQYWWFRVALTFKFNNLFCVTQMLSGKGCIYSDPEGFLSQVTDWMLKSNMGRGIFKINERVWDALQMIIESSEFHGAGGCTVPEIFSLVGMHLFDCMWLVLKILTWIGVLPSMLEGTLLDSPSWITGVCVSYYYYDLEWEGHHEKWYTFSLHTLPTCCPNFTAVIPGTTRCDTIFVPSSQLSHLILGQRFGRNWAILEGYSKENHFKSG